MRDRGPSRRRRAVAGALALVAVVWAAPAAAQEAAPGASEAAATPTVVEAAPVPLSDVSAAAIRDRGALRALRDDLGPVAPVLEIETALAGTQETLKRDETRARRVLAGEPSGETLEELETIWAARRRQLDGWGKVLQARSRWLQDGLDELARLEIVWSKTLEQARQEQAPRVVLSRIDELRDEVAETAVETRRRQSEILTTQEKVGLLRAGAESVLGDVRRARSQFVTHLFDPQVPPIWDWFSRRGDAAEVAHEARDSLLAQVEAIDEYLRVHWSDFLLRFLAASIVALFLYRGRQRAAKWVEEDPALESVGRAFSVPFSMAALLLVFVLTWTNPLAPPALTEMLALLALIPAVRLLKRLVPPRLFAGVYGLAAFSLIDRLRSLLYASPRIEWSVFLLEMLAALLLAVRIFSPERVGDIGWPADDWRRRLLLTARKLVIGIFVIAIFATCLGYVRLGSLLGDGVLGSAYVAILIYALAETFKGLWTYFLRSRLASSLRSVRNHRWLLQRRGHRLFSMLFFFAWGVATLRAFALLSPFWDALSAIFAARFERGNVSLSLGDVVLFAVSVWAALQLSRFLRFVLDEDVFARVQLAHGASYAVSTLLHYFLIISGFLIGVSAVGFDLGSFAIVAGALGVGIGFGLQNIVNNFVSGLILLFERPIQVGDAVEVGSLSGEVRHIGIRASTIRTWNGAELIVPNGNLIAETVTNWTLSDRMRRIDIPVGVAYGTDPEEVLRILEEVARANPNVVSSPGVSVLFIGFGDSSIDFEVRAWTARFENWLSVRTEILIALNRALSDAGIEIPYPRRDVHLRSLEPQAARMLRGADADAPPDIGAGEADGDS